MGLFVWYFGTTAGTDVEHHTIIMGKVFKELLEDIYDRKILSDDLSLYLPTGSTDCSMAPEGGYFYVLAPVPNKLAKWTGW